MKPHVQAWFTIPFDAAQVSDANALIGSVLNTRETVPFESMTQDQFDAITDKLKGGFIVEVKRAGDRVSLPTAPPVYLHVPFNAAIGEQIKSWIREAAHFNPAEVAVDAGSVLVEVRAECCGRCSSGLACDCTVYNPF
jgi:hypothetical protein